MKHQKAGVGAQARQTSFAFREGLRQYDGEHGREGNQDKGRESWKTEEGNEKKAKGERGKQLVWSEVDKWNGAQKCVDHGTDKRRREEERHPWDMWENGKAERKRCDTKMDSDSRTLAIARGRLEKGTFLGPIAIRIMTSWRWWVQIPQCAIDVNSSHCKLKACDQTVGCKQENS